MITHIYSLCHAICELAADCLLLTCTRYCNYQYDIDTIHVPWYTSIGWPDANLLLHGCTRKLLLVPASGGDQLISSIYAVLG
jgi:hypothetical protein